MHKTMETATPPYFRLRIVSEYVAVPRTSLQTQSSIVPKASSRLLICYDSTDFQRHLVM